MYYCNSCHRPFSQFDLAFNQKLFPGENVTTRGCKCAKCRTQGEERFWGLEKPKISVIMAHIISIIFFSLYIASYSGLLFEFFMPLFPLADYGALYTQIGEYKIYFGKFIDLLDTIINYGSLFSWLFCGAFVVSNFETNRHFKFFKDAGSYTEYYAETTFNSSTGNASTQIKSREVNYSDGSSDHIIKGIWFVLAFPLWSIPHLIYILFFKRIVTTIILRKYYPKTVIKAYKYAMKTTKYIHIPTNTERTFKKALDKFENNHSSVINKYTVIGEDAYTYARSEFKIPLYNIFIKGKRYLLVGCRNDVYCLLCKENGILSGKVIVDNYFVDMQENEWRDVFQTKMNYNLYKFIDDYARYI